jgi:ketosteroid isomerase-like protein
MKTTSTLIIITVIAFDLLSLSRPHTSVAAQSIKSEGASDNSLEQQIVAKEREGLDALKVGDVDRFGNLTADDAVLVDAHGPATKAEVIKNVAGFRLTDYTMDDIRFVPLSATSGLIAYKIIEKGVSHEREFAVQAYVSSIWAERGGKWLCLFSQETPARPVTPK